jgi:hypothetical protein
MHGGGTPAGIAHPSFRHGRAARRYPLSGYLEERYARHLSDLDYIALRDELALVSARLEEALVAEDRDSERQLIDLRRRLVTAEAARIKLAQDTLSGEAIRTFAAAVLKAVREETRDLTLTGRIQERTLTILKTIGAIQ